MLQSVGPEAVLPEIIYLLKRFHRLQGVAYLGQSGNHEYREADQNCPDLKGF